MRRLLFPLLLIAAPAALAGEFRSIGENATPLYDAPSVKAEKLFVASRFYPVEVIVQVDNWTKVPDRVFFSTQERSPAASRTLVQLSTWTITSTG